MKSRFTELALYGSTTLCGRTDTVFLPLSQVCDGTVSLILLAFTKTFRNKIVFKILLEGFKNKQQSKSIRKPKFELQCHIELRLEILLESALYKKV